MNDLTNIDTTFTKRFRTISLKVDERYRQCHQYQALQDPASVYYVVRSIFNKLDDGQEHFVVLFLSTAGRLIGYKILFSGSQNSAVVDPVTIYRNAILFGSAAIICVHNHPSGNLTPSAEDKEITRQITKVGAMHGIPLYDHLIVNHYDFLSLGMYDPSLFE